MATKNTDQIRRLANSVTLAGYLADIESKQGVDKNGVDYIRIRGQIQCGEDSVMTRSFTSFIKAKKADGTDSENYEKVLDWVKKAVPMTKDKENATMVRLVGSLSANDYVGSDEQLHEGTVASMQFFNDFEEFACDLDIEGYIKSITDEERGSEDDKKPTGRKRLNLISMDFYHNALDIKNIIIPKDFVDALEDNGYVKGATAKMYVSWKPNEKGEAKPKTKGFGQQRVTEGKSYLEMVLTGGDIAYDEDEQEDMIITTQMCKAMLNERASRLKELEEAGYQGSKGSSGSSTPTGFGKKGSGKMSPVVDDDDDIPF